MADDIQRTLGAHGAKLESLEQTVKGIAANVETLVASENRREGAKRAVYSIAAIAGAVSSLAVSAAVKLWPK